MTNKFRLILQSIVQPFDFRGISGYGKSWEEFYDKEADFAFFNVLKSRLKPEIRVVEVDSHINDTLFAERATDLFDGLMHKVA